MLEKDLQKAVGPIVDQLLEQNDRIEKLESVEVKNGVDGKDAEPLQVAVELMANQSFVDSIRGKDGQSVERDDVIKALMDNDEFVESLRGKDGESVERDEVVEAIKGDKEFVASIKGTDGLGINIEKWQPKIYREGSIVQHAAGKYYRATKDTNDEPRQSDDWERVGTAGFEWTGLKSDRDYEDGDIYIDGGSAFIWWADKGHMLVQRGKPGAKGDKGIDGRNGADAANIVAAKFDEDSLHFALDDGNIISADVEFLDAFINNKVLTFLSEQEELPEYSTPIKVFRGAWSANEAYKVGDVVEVQKATWLCHTAAAKGSDVNADSWVKLASLSAAGGGGGGGAGGWPPIVTSALNMFDYSVQNMHDPRTGPVGAKDAVSKGYMEKAIAAGALYQGVYTVETNNPDLHTKADVTYTFPTADAHFNPPPGLGAVTPQTGNTVVWFDISAGNLHATTWPHTLDVPLNMEIRFSNGEVHKFAVPVGTYNTWLLFEAAIIAEINAHAGIHNAHFKPGTTDLWVGIETTPPLYATFITDQVTSPFPAATPGTGNTILNTYNWVIQTKDENVPMSLPAGIPGISAGTMVKNSDLLQWSAALNGFEIISGSSLTQSYSDQRYWQINNANFAWVDQKYNRGAVVLHGNAWWQATQNILVGSAEPGSVAAAAIWNQINNSFGSRTFYGTADFDPVDTSAANNWGMPTGTTPAGVQPLDGDAYFDVTSGSVTDFTVFTPPPVFVITGTFDVATAVRDQVGILSTGPAPGKIDALTFNVDAAAQGFTAGDNYYWNNPAQNTITAGYFTGVSLNAGDYYFVYVGDPDAQDGGWVIITDTGTGPYTYTLPTPHAQVVPDVIAGTTTYGYRRNFELTFDATVVDNSYRTVLKNFALEPASYVIELQDEDVDGSYYKFELTTARSVAAIIAPVTFIVHDDHILTIGTSFVAGTGGAPGSIDLCVKLNASGASKAFRVVVTSEVGNLTRLTLADGTEAPVDPNTNYETRSKGAASKNYPSEDLENMLKAMSGDAEAAIPIKGMKVGQDVKNRDVTIEPGKITRIIGYATNTVSNFTPLIRFKENGAGIPDANFQFDCYGRTDYNSAVSDWPVSDIQRSDAGFVVGSAWENMKGQTVHAELTVDSRDPNMTYFSYECWGYYSSTSHRTYGFFKGHFKNGASPDAFYFSHFNAEPDTEWRVYKD